MGSPNFGNQEVRLDLPDLGNQRQEVQVGLPDFGNQEVQLDSPNFENQKFSSKLLRNFKNKRGG
ncbi:MAG: hypothetical protein RR131_03735 [Anaerovorax sp.]